MTATEIRALRKRLGLTQAEFARVYGTGYRALTDWERGKRHPSDAGASLLRAIARDPQCMARLLA